MSLSLKMISHIIITVLLSTNIATSWADLPPSLETPNVTLHLNGEATRSKFFIQIYDLGLYLPTPNTNPTDIIKANSPMALILEITTDKVTPEKMKSAIIESFSDATNGDTSDIQPELDKFIKIFEPNITKGDVYKFIFTPETGISIVKNGKTDNIINSFKFKEVLFSIWLGENPVSNSMKNKLLKG